MNKLQAIKKGSQIIDQIFRELLILLKSETKLTEREVASFIRRRANELGASGMAFPPIVSFGKGSSEIHHKPGPTKIGRKNFLMLDYGVKVQGYCSDFTRTLFIGTPNKLQVKVYNTVLAAEISALRKVKIGAECAVVDLTARNTILKAGFARYYNHSTGHGVGLKIHELPSFSPASPAVLQSGLVMTVEPGIYLPRQFGVRIEDMVEISGKPRVLSKIPKDLRSMTI